MNFKFLITTATVLALLVSCKETPKEEVKETKELPQGQLQTDLAVFQDSATHTWENMILADDQKIAFVKRLLDEVSYMPKYDIVKHGKLAEKCKALKGKRYSEEGNMTSKAIDDYDAATDSLLAEVKAFVLATPNVENYPLCSDLLKDITALDNDVITHRVMYDTWAQRYNALLAEHKETLSSLGEPYASMKKKNTFQLEE